MKFQWKKLAVVSLAAALLGANMISLAEESAQSRRFSVMSVSGEEAYATRGAGKEGKAAAGMPLGQGSKLRTGGMTSMYIEADNDKTIKLDSNTQAEITKVSSKALKITLKSGELFFNVEKPLKEGEELTFDAAQTSMSIRGTSGVLGFSGNQLILYLIEGQVQWKIGNETITVNAGQKAVLGPASEESLQARGMASGYQLQELNTFNWSDLSTMGLEAVLEQVGHLDGSFIGMTGEEIYQQAAERLSAMKAEKDAREKAQMEQASAGSSGALRIDGKEPKVSSGGNGTGGGGARRENTTETSAAIGTDTGAGSSDSSLENSDPATSGTPSGSDGETDPPNTEGTSNTSSDSPSPDTQAARDVLNATP